MLAHLHRYGKGVAPEFEDPITRHLMSTRWKYGSWAAYVVEADLRWWCRISSRLIKPTVPGLIVFLICHGLKSLLGRSAAPCLGGVNDL